MNNRIARINSLIKKELSQIFLREFDVPKDVLVTLTRVETSPDLKFAKVFISVWPQKLKEKFLANLGKNVFFFQKKLNKKLTMRNVPKIIFIEEKKLSEAGRIEEILEKLKKEKK